MYKQIVCATIVTMTTFSHAYAEVPAAVAASLKAALATGDAFVIDATRQAAAAQYPAIKDEILQFGQAPAPTTPAVAETAPVFVEEKVAAVPSYLPKNWSGDVEVGFNLQRGNTKKRDLVSAAKIKYDIEEWRHTLTLKANSSFENSTRTEEDYRFGWETAYDLNQREFVFAQAEYVNDMFSGYNYRVTENAGYGRYLIKEQKMELKAQAGVGGQHTEEMLANNRERLTHTVILKPEVDFKWQVNDRLDFNAAAKSTIGKEVTVSNVEAAFKTGLAEHLSAKLSVDFEHVNKVPYGTKKTDTTTALKLVYDF